MSAAERVTYRSRVDPDVPKRSPDVVGVADEVEIGLVGTRDASVPSGEAATIDRDRAPQRGHGGPVPRCEDHVVEPLDGAVGKLDGVTSEACDRAP